jgi:phosphatidylglycerol:prolipoprotein diacylglycerol transferase
MFPVILRVGSFQLTSFGVMMALAFLVAGVVFARELGRKGENPERAWDLVMFAALGGVLGAKLYYLVLFWPETAADPLRAVTSRAGLVWYGGLIGGAAMVLWQIGRRRLPVLQYGDAAAPALALGYVLGRIGCFLVGDDYGRPTNLPWGIAFPNGAPPSTAFNLRDQFGVNLPASVPDTALLRVHPTQLYEAVLMLVIFSALWHLRTRLTRPGMLLALYVALAAAERFIVEIFRAKDDRVMGPLSVAQLISIGLAAAAGAWLLARGGRSRPQALGRPVVARASRTRRTTAKVNTA